MPSAESERIPLPRRAHELTFRPRYLNDRSPASSGIASESLTVTANHPFADDSRMRQRTRVSLFLLLFFFPLALFILVLFPFSYAALGCFLGIHRFRPIVRLVVERRTAVTFDVGT